MNYIFWLKKSQKAINCVYVKIKYYKFPTSIAPAILTKVVTS